MGRDGKNHTTATTARRNDDKQRCAQANMQREAGIKARTFAICAPAVIVGGGKPGTGIVRGLLWDHRPGPGLVGFL
jgi:hypothetical protein